MIYRSLASLQIDASKIPLSFPSMQVLTNDWMLRIRNSKYDLVSAPLITLKFFSSIDELADTSADIFVSLLSKVI